MTMVGTWDLNDARKLAEDATGPGWKKLILELIDKIEKIDPTIEVHQIKEKFGGLRFYVGGTLHEGIFELIQEYEDKSYKVCEECGEKGKLREELPWMKTLCDDDFKKAKEKYNERLKKFRSDKE